MLTTDRMREALHEGARAAFAGDECTLRRIGVWCETLSASALVQLDGYARRSSWSGPDLGPPAAWTEAVLQHETAAALASLHPSGFVRERAVRALSGRRTALADRMLALRTNDHVPPVALAARAAVLERADLAGAAEIVPVLGRLDGRVRGSAALTAYLARVSRSHGDTAVWASLRRSGDRDMRRLATRHSIERGHLGAVDAVAQLPREKDQVVRRLLTQVIAERADPATIATILLRARSAECRALGLIRLGADQIDEPTLRRLLVDTSVLVRMWARRRWSEAGRDVVTAYRSLTSPNAPIARRARAFTGLAEAGTTIEHAEVRRLVESDQRPIVKVGLQLLVGRAEPDDVDLLLRLAAGDETRVARLACDVLVGQTGLWDLDDISGLTDSADPAVRRRGWRLHRGRSGWDEVIADLLVLGDPDRDLALMGRQVRPPRYGRPDADQRAEVASLLGSAPLAGDRKLEIALAAGLRELVDELRASPWVS